MRKRILVAPLNWGLGHATRCIPIINALLKANFTPVIASDGISLLLLQKEFPQLESIELPSYNITYPINGKNFKRKIIWDSPKLIKVIRAEKKIVAELIGTYAIDGIISDNRFGVHSKKVPSVFITHQLNVLTGSTTWLSTKIHLAIMKKFDECWIPDVDGKPNLSGRLGHIKKSRLRIKYMGPISRLAKKEIPLKYDVMAILSGPEPQRTFLEQKLLTELQKHKGKILFIRGKIENKQHIEQTNNITIYNYMSSFEIETAINESAVVLSRSGYTTIMDLAKLEKKAFFIPTPGQFEQVYLAKRLKKNGIVPSCAQEKFTISKLGKISLYSGLSSFDSKIDLSDLFCLFQRK
ncbi:glycosyltransferase [Ascidiimonas sp. W6]|uniref:glycosyltransferase n=1 Tax=Ascidiimonas meishanensis TaxID=3128903 RepID=UPI0030EF5E13